MPNNPNEKCYPAGANQPLMCAGYALIVLGVIMLFVCIPCWVWLALLGVVLMVVGVVLLRFSKAWR